MRAAQFRLLSRLVVMPTDSSSRVFFKVLALRKHGMVVNQPFAHGEPRHQLRPLCPTTVRPR